MARTQRPPRLPARRKDELAASVIEAGEVTVIELAGQFGVSVDTVRRDLDELSAEGVITRTHGGAVRNTLLARAETPIPDRMNIQGSAKRRIGKLAASLVDDGQTILLNGGTTTLAILPHLAARRNLTVVTNNLLAPVEVPPGCVRDVYLLGGNVRIGSQVTVGPVEFPGTDGGRSLRIQADLALISVGGVAAEMGYSTSNLQEARMMLEMMHASGRVVVLADSSKLNRSSFAQVAELAIADVLVTDVPVDERLGELLANARVKILVAGEPADNGS
jgi:DeoR family transcriptional regulator, fructose operon transcriptional repressor